MSSLEEKLINEIFEEAHLKHLLNVKLMSISFEEGMASTAWRMAKAANQTKMKNDELASANGNVILEKAYADLSDILSMAYVLMKRK